MKVLNLGPMDVPSVTSFMQVATDPPVHSSPSIIMSVTNRAGHKARLVLDFDNPKTGVVSVCITLGDERIEPVCRSGQPLYVHRDFSAATDREDFVRLAANLTLAVDEFIEHLHRGNHVVLDNEKVVSA